MKNGEIYVCRMCGNRVQVVHVGGGKLVCCDVPMEKEAVEPAAGKADRHIIFGIHVTNRVKRAAEVQHVLTDFGACIKTRLGLHEVQGDACSPNGLVMVEFGGDPQRSVEMFAKLNEIEGVEVKQMTFDHP